ncbi:hypothetical protein HYX05_01495 [Candidatus Woesearchaeota archaeon]|nr:hypothetical protein [Candidatus Woesearchaeota archaeon]
MSLEILTEERFNELIKGRLLTALDGRTPKFVSGYIHRIDSADGNQPNSGEIHVVYEIAHPLFIRLIAEYFMTLRIRPDVLGVGTINAVTYISEELDTLDSIAIGLEDTSYLLFGSKRLYKAFLHVLDEQKRRKSITDEEYLKVLERVNIRSRKMNYQMSGKSIFHRNEVLRQFREVLGEYPLIRPYLAMASLRLAEQQRKY